MVRLSRIMPAVFFACFAILAVDLSGEEISVTFSKIADTNTPLPGGTGNFRIFEYWILNDNVVAFIAWGDDIQHGVYWWTNGHLDVVADRNTPIPDGIGAFTNFGDIALDNRVIAFNGHRSGLDYQDGIYTYDGDSLCKVADRNTTIPNGHGTFRAFHSTDINVGRVTFLGQGDDFQKGVYESDIRGSSLAIVADKNTPIPGSSDETFVAFTNLVSDGGAVAFMAAGAGGWWIYTDVSGQLEVVVNSETPVPGGHGNFLGVSWPRLDDGVISFTGGGSDGKGIYMSENGLVDVEVTPDAPIPGGTGTFWSFGFPVLNDRSVAFRGTAGEQLGIYTTAPGPLRVVADSNTPVPDWNGNFIGFGDPALNGDIVVFFGYRDRHETMGIYADVRGHLQKILTPTDTLDGKVVDGLHSGANSFVNNRVLFFVSFTDGSSGLYLAELTPSVMPVEIDIRPFSRFNWIIPGFGRVPVAVLTTEDFDAQTIDEQTARFGPAGASIWRGRSRLTDLDCDGDLDLLMFFRTKDTGIRCGDTEATLTGETFSGEHIEGTDSIRTLWCRNQIEIDQSNLLESGWGWTAMSWDMVQTFKPSTPVLTGVDIDIVTANPQLGDDIITVEIVHNGQVLARSSQNVSVGFDGLLHFDFPELPVIVGDTYAISLPGSKDTFGWKYSGGDTYPGGMRFLGGTPMVNHDWLFQTYGRRY